MHFVSSLAVVNPSMPHMSHQTWSSGNLDRAVKSDLHFLPESSLVVGHTNRGCQSVHIDHNDVIVYTLVPTLAHVIVSASVMVLACVMVLAHPLVSDCICCVVVLSCVMVAFSVGHCYSDSLCNGVKLFPSYRTPFTVLLCDNLVLWRLPLLWC